MYTSSDVHGIQTAGSAPLHCHMSSCGAACLVKKHNCMRHIVERFERAENPVLHSRLLRRRDQIPEHCLIPGRSCLQASSRCLAVCSQHKTTKGAPMQPCCCRSYCYGMVACNTGKPRMDSHAALCAWPNQASPGLEHQGAEAAWCGSRTTCWMGPITSLPRLLLGLRPRVRLGAMACAAAGRLWTDHAEPLCCTPGYQGSLIWQETCMLDGPKLFVLPSLNSSVRPHVIAHAGSSLTNTTRPHPELRIRVLWQQQLDSILDGPYHPTAFPVGWRDTICWANDICTCS